MPGLTKTIGATETPITLRSGKGSPIRSEDNVLIFLNDILQVPSESYKFVGGSRVVFPDPPKFGDKIRIYYYRGSDNDVVDVDILENVKVGDSLTLMSIQNLELRMVSNRIQELLLVSPPLIAVSTNTYIEVGITTNAYIETCHLEKTNFGCSC